MRHFLLLAALTALSCGARTPKEETMIHLCNRVFSLAEEQTVYMDSLLPDGRCPRTFQGDTLVTSDIGWWTSGFYPGVLWQMYSLTGEERFHDLAVKHTLPLAALLDQKTDHDIGFQLMCSFAQWQHYDATHKHEMDVLSAEQLDSILTKGAAKLAARYVPEAGVIRSWDWGAWNIPVIIDNMMNLELLMVYGDWEIAEKHALTTARNHFRDDGTTFHLVDYADDGSVLGRQTFQGYADDSAWARGQAWALFGYAMMARLEMDPEIGRPEQARAFNDIAYKLAEWIIPHLPDDGVPFWDFSQKDYRDASAGAIIAAGLLDLWENDPDRDPERKLVSAAERILRTLASPEYLAEPRTNGGFLLKHGVGNLPSHSEVDVPLTYADYYFLYALRSYRWIEKNHSHADPRL
jgi:hypothetical protein